MEKELNEKKNDLITRAEEVLNKAKGEKRELTPDEAQELAEIRDDVRKIKETLELKGFFDKEGGEKPVEKVEVEKEVEETRALEEEKAFENYEFGFGAGNGIRSYRLRWRNRHCIIHSVDRHFKCC